MSTDRNVVLCKILLRHIRAEAKSEGIKLPTRLTALRHGSKRKGEGWFLVEGNGFSKEIWAHNAYDARGKALRSIINSALKDKRERELKDAETRLRMAADRF